MYTRYFGLAHLPFSIAPDPRYLFMSERHREALAHLLYGLDGGGGFVLLTGEIGAGKTTVCRLFLEQIPKNCNVAYIFNPKQTVIELLQSICDEFGIETTRAAQAGATVKDFIDPLNAFLLTSHAEHKNNILIIDEAQNLSADVLEQLRLLTNLETSQRKLLQIILIGQPELRSMLARPELEQLAQRIIARFHLAALSAEETARYIAHRLAVAGMAQASPFGEPVMRRIHALSRGIPRRINLLCDRALLGAYARGKQTVDLRTVSIAAHEVFDADRAPGLRLADNWRPVALGAALMASVAVAAAMVATGGRVLSGAKPPMANATMPVEHARDENVVAGKPVRSAMTTDFASAVAPSNQPARPNAPAAKAATSTVTSMATSMATSAATAAAPPTPPPRAAPSEPPPAGTASMAITDASVRDLSAALRRLAGAWNVTLDAGEACHAAARQALYCFTSRNGLSEIRQLDRPGVLTLWDDAHEKYYALLLGLDRDTALLQIGERRETVTLAALAKRWHGGFTTLWRGPPNYRKSIVIGKRDETVDWLAARLASVSGNPVPSAGAVFDVALGANLREFQLAQGLLPDGLPGPQTLMRLAATAGDQGPHLQTAAAVPVAALAAPAAPAASAARPVTPSSGK